MSLFPLLFSALFSCATSAPQPQRTVVVISWDTTRADALGCYQDVSHWGLNLPPTLRPAPRTPTADALASSGVRFQWAFSAAPTTLNSHTSFFSGQDPHQHRVVRNGYPIPDDVPLLAEQLLTEGWETVAVVGSSALEASMGLNRGFVSYDDPGPQPQGGMYMRNASDVTIRALDAISNRQHPERDLFLFVHYYDPHTPWFTAPDALVGSMSVEGYAGPVDGSMPSIGYLSEQRQTGRMRIDDVRQARALYLAQVAWADQQTGVLLRGLEERGLMENSLVVLMSDHGESLEEHSRFPYGHGPDVDLMNTHVPLVVTGRGALALPEDVVVDRPVRLLDMATTLGRMLTPDAPRLGSGEDLTPLWKGVRPPTQPIFAEATKPIEKESRNTWNNLPFERSVIHEGLILVKSPWAEEGPRLFQMAPGQPERNDPAAAAKLELLLDAWDASAPPHRNVQMSTDTTKALQSLGYLDGASDETP
ncbi:MAG: sulfatase [Myxococcota bacterium]